MSRSYKHSPVYQDQNGKRAGKKYANKIARQNIKNKEDVADGKAYKKLYDSWNISDYSFRTTWQDYLKNYWFNKEDGLYYSNRRWNRNNRGYTLEELYNEWAKVFLRK